jgi:uncharacterized protein (TIGR02145 family)
MRLFLTLRKFGFQAASNVQSFHLFTVLSAKRIAFAICLLASFSQQLAAQPWLNPNLTYGSVNDVDGNVYPTIQIGNQLWMAENLRTTRFSNGDAILNQTNFNLWSGQPGPGVTPQWCYYQNNGAYNVPFGKMYNWYVAADIRNVCPVGWHVPSIAEWYEMFSFIDSTVAPSTTYFIEHPNLGGQLKSTGTLPGINAYWNAPNTGATNEFGFSALGAGYSENSGLYQGTRMWSTTGDIIAPDGCAQIVQFNNNDALTEVVGCDFGYKTSAGSIRCVKAVNNRCDFGIPFIYPPCINEFYICPGDTTPTLQTFVEYTSPDIDYQWYSIDGLPIIGATSNQYTPDTFNSLGSYQYYLIVNPNTECSAISEIFTINVVDGSQFVGYATDHTICEGFTVTLAPNVNYQGGTCQWSNGSDFPFQTFEATESVTLGFNYSIGSCINYADSITLTVIPKPTVNIQSNVDCQTGEVTLTAVADTPGGTYRWRTGEVTNEITVTQQLGSFQSVEYETFGCSAIGTNCFDDAIIKYFDHSDNGIFCINDYLTLFCDCNGQDYAELNTFVIGVAGNFAGIEGACSEALRNIATDTVQISINSLSVCGCTDPSASNYNPSATVDDGSFIFNSCFNLDIIAIQEPCLYVSSGELLPSARIYTIYDGNCTVDSLFVIDNTADTTLAFDVFGTSGSFQLLNGFDVFSNYGIYYMLDDGSVSPIFDFTTTDCSNDPTLCDCDQNVHSIGVYTWLGDSYADDGAFLWQGETVNFNCATWGYDCGDIFGAPSNDPFGVCSGNLPPNNGCSDALTVSATDITVECDAVLYPENYPISVIGACTADYTLTFTDQTIAGIEVPCDHTVLRTWNVTDACGNQASTSSTIYFIDTTPPEFLFYPPDMELDCSDAIPTFQPFVIENCGDYFLTLTEEYIPTGVCQEWFDVVRIVEVYDECGNFNSDTITYYIRDYTAPLFFNNGPSTFFVPYGEQFVTPTPQVFDDCSSYFLSSIYQPDIFDLCGSYSVVWTAQDQCNNASTYTQNVVVSGPTFEFVPCDDNDVCTVNDHISPDCTCDGELLDNNFNGICDILENGLTVNASNSTLDCSYAPEDLSFLLAVNGACSANYSVTFVDETVGCCPTPCDYTINRIWTVTDECGNSASATSTLTFTDFIPPYFTNFPTDMVLDCNDLLPAFQPQVFDNCDNNVNTTLIEYYVPSGVCDQWYDVVRIAVAVDQCDNLTSDTVTYTIRDYSAPIFSPFNTTTYFLSYGEQFTVPNPTASDDCSTITFDNIIEPNPFDLCGSYSVLWTATDQCNNASTYTQNVVVSGPTLEFIPCDDFNDCTIDDHISPDCVCLGTYVCTDTLFGCTDPLATNYNPNATIDDGSCTYGTCSNYQLTFTPRPCEFNPNIGDVSPAFNVSYSYNGTCNVDQVVVLDEFGLPNPFATNATSDSSGGFFNFIYLLSETTYGVYLIMSDGSISPTFNYTTGTCGGTICDCNGTQHTESVTLWLGDNFADAGGFSLNGQPVDFNCATWGYDCGDILGAPSDDPYGVCDGNLPPNNGCSDPLTVTAWDITVECADLLNSEYYPITVTGACNSTYTVDYIDFIADSLPSPCEYTLIRTWIITDDCGNQGSASSTIYFIDNVAPQFINFPVDMELDCNDPLPVFQPLVNENCGQFYMTWTEEYIPSGVCQYWYDVVRVAEVIDDCGNFNSDTVTYTIRDYTAPLFLGNGPSTFIFTYGEQLDTPTPQVVDDCSDFFLSRVNQPNNFDLCGSYSVLWTATDQCNNASTFTQNVVILGPTIEFVPCDDNDICTVNDHISPNCTCEGELFDNNFNGICDYDEGTLNVTAQNDIINCTYDVDDLNYLLSVSGG